MPMISSGWPSNASKETAAQPLRSRLNPRWQQRALTDSPISASSRPNRRPRRRLLTGTIRESVEETPVTEKRKRCTEYDPADAKKCLKEVNVDIRCRRRVATLATTIRLVAINDGSIRWSRPLNARDQQTWCPDRDYMQSVDNFIAGALRGQVQTIRGELAPNNYTLDVRVDESRKGLPKPAEEAFKQAIRQTKSDQAAHAPAGKP